ncbi:pentatricopeptide repeat-containing protein At5g55740, chloroplastic [Nymphaea colorata]|nr:pentatricopeptide repeat-containing protein At5g55740, chloroplastic [Nymphaea colorata]
MASSFILPSFQIFPTKRQPHPSSSATAFPILPSSSSSSLTVSKSAETKTDNLSASGYYSGCVDQISKLCEDGRLGDAISIFNQMKEDGIQTGHDIYGEILQGFVYQRSLFGGKQIHAQIIKNGASFSENEFLHTKLVIFYAKCDVRVAADYLFSSLPSKNVFSWAAMIGFYVRKGLNEECLLSFSGMLDSGVLPDNFVIPNALKACSSLQSLQCGRLIHGYIVKLGYGSCVFVASSLVDMYGKCGELGCARLVFDEIPEKNAVAWNSMLVGYFQNGENEEALRLFYQMRVESDVEPSRVTIASFLSASANLASLSEGKQGHAIAVRLGLPLDSILGSGLVNFYAKCSSIVDAELVFDLMLERDVVVWNLLISGYIQDGHIEDALDLCRRMQLENFRPDSVTLASILSACADCGDLRHGLEGHGYCIRNNLELDVFVASSIIDMYGKCRRIEDARKAFDCTMQRDVVLWNTLMAAYSESGCSGEALKLFYQMQLAGLLPNVVSWNAVILGFLRNGQVTEAKDFFMQMQSTGTAPNSVTWTTLISGLAQNGHGSDAFDHFEKMQAAGLKPNAMVIVGLLMAATALSLLQPGKQIHAYIARHGLAVSPWIMTSLVDMYAKCGSVNLARKVFDVSSVNDLPLYNAMISGYALHGKAVEALSLFNQMQLQGIKPDAITFTSILSACSHAGFLDEGQRIFKEMSSIHNIQPRIEHFGCVVDILSRRKKIYESLPYISSILNEIDGPIIGSLLAACRDQNDAEIGEALFKILLELEPSNSGNYIVLSNMYAASDRWHDATKIRNIMRINGLRKNPGCSWIHIGGKSHAFVAGDKSHPETETLYQTLYLLDKEMRFADYILLINDKGRFAFPLEIARSQGSED